MRWPSAMIMLALRPCTGSAHHGQRGPDPDLTALMGNLTLEDK
eukprot:gene10502-9236_t